MGPLRVAIACTLAACASAGDPKPADIDAPGTTNPDGNSSIRQCLGGELATNVSATGSVTCGRLETSIQTALDASCSVYMGWRDDCDGCATPPAKWARAGTTCSMGVGGDNTCTKPQLGAAMIDLAGVNLDGDMDGNDKLYGSLHCVPQMPEVATAPCPEGQFVSGLYGSSWTCSSLKDIVADYARNNCSLYMGWQDNCDGCANAPVKWGRAGDTSCQNGLGADNTCQMANLGGEMVNLFGLNPDGDVNDDDKIHVGLHCVPPQPAMSSATMQCPVGQFVTGTATDNTFTCASPAPQISQYFTQKCSVYFGWRDGCDGCIAVPAKWGSARVGGCTLGVGANDTCGKFIVGQTTDMFGLNTDGDVDGNDTLYVGFRCM